MDTDRLFEVLHASEVGDSLEPSRGRSLVSLISFRTLGTPDFGRIRAFQGAIKSHLGLTSIVVGGGYGCTKVVVKIIELESDDPAEIQRALTEVLYGESFRTEARKVPFDVLVTSQPYERRDLRTGSLDGLHQPSVTIIAQEVTVGQKHGDQYNVNSAGIVGPNARVANFQQVWNDWRSEQGAPDPMILGDQLSRLRQELKGQATSAEQDAAVGAVAKAEVAAKQNDGSKALEALGDAGKWALGVAEKIGVTLAAAAIRKALGLA